MHPALQPFQFMLSLVRGLVLRARSIGGAQESRFGTMALARRMRRAIRLVEAYLRRVLIVLALEIEPTLVDTSKAVERRKARKTPARPPAVRFVVLRDPDRAFPEDGVPSRRLRGRRARVGVPLGRLYLRLDRLAAIAGAPMARARRLAFHLARRRPGPILAPDLRLRMPSRWGPEAGASFDAMAYAIPRASMRRPPPLPPPRRWGPSITIMHW